MSKGNKAVCMRLPEPLLGIIETEAQAAGVSVPEFCRRVISERKQEVKEEGAKAGLTIPSPRLSTNVAKAENSKIETPTPRPTNFSQNANEVGERVVNAVMLAGIMEKFPELSPPTEAQRRAREGLAKLAEKKPEEFSKLFADMIIKGEMSVQEAANFLRVLGVN